MKNQKFLVTGAAGFIGSHLCEFLTSEGHQVIAFDRYNSENDHGWLNVSQFKDDIEVVLGDIRDYDSVSRIISRCDVVFHLAALIGIPYSYVSPMAYIKTNIEGTYNVLESARNHCLDQVIITSTSETYGTAQYVPIDEMHPIVGQSPYSASKIGADQLALSYHKSFDLPVKIARPFNTFGPRQSSRAIIPTIISQILNRSKKLNLGSLSPTRDFTYVMDTCKGFYEIFNNNLFFGEATNIGTSNEISMGELVKTIKKIMGSDILIAQKSERLRPEKSEVNRLYCDNTKLIKNSKWQIEYTLSSGLELTIEWMKEKENFSKYKPEIFNV